MLAFHNDTQIKKNIILQLRAHAKADEIIKGKYWQNGKGCAVGCTIHSNQHVEYETRFGIPQMLARLEDCIFEGLPSVRAKKWPIKFMSAIKPGVDLSRVGWKFLHWTLTDEQINPGINHPLVKDAVKRCADIIADLANGKPQSAAGAERSAARSAAGAESAAGAAWSAAGAARSAERSAAWSAAGAARSAERSAARSAAGAAWSAESAAWSAERSAAWSAERSAARSAERSAARSAAWSAESAAGAARSAERSAARSADSAARSAAGAARSAAGAAWSAESAAWSAAWVIIADKLLELWKAA